MPSSVANDPSQPMRVETFRCVAGRALEIKKRADRHEHRNDKPNRDGSKWDDGLHYYVVPHDTD
jgi:hypothetical protein